MGSLRLGELKIAQIKLQVLVYTSHYANGTHTSDTQKVKVTVCENRPDRYSRFPYLRIASARIRSFNKPDHRECDQNNHYAQGSQRIMPSGVLFKACRTQGNQGSSRAYAKVCNTHSLTAVFIKPPGNQHLAGQRSAASITDRIENIKKIKQSERVSKA